MSLRTSRSFVLSLAGIALLFVLAAAQDAHACSCSSTASGHQTCQDRWTYAAVFVGRVIAIDPASRQVNMGVGGTQDYPERSVRIAVSEAFSGVGIGETTIRTSLGEAQCGFGFIAGNEYLVYAHRRPNGVLATSICSPTKRADQAAVDLSYLRTVPSVPGRDGGLIGVVMHYEPSNWTGATRRSPVAGMRVVAEGEGLRRAGTTGPDGKYEIRLPPGRYQLRPDPPAGMYARVNYLIDSTVELKDARGCAVVDVSVGFDGHIAARAVTTSGVPVPFLPFALRATDAQWPASSVDGRTGADGRIDIGQVPQGSFVIVTPLALGGVSSAVVNVAPGAKVDAGTIVVPDNLRFVTVTGLILDSLGRPAQGARVYLEADSKELKLIGPAVVTGADGRFSLAALDGETYLIVAERVASPGRLVKDEIRVTVSPTMAGITLRPDVK